MQGKEVGTVRVRKGSCNNGAYAIDVHLVPLADSKHTSIILTNFSATIRNGDGKNKSGIGIGAIQAWWSPKKYLHGRYEVDNNNINNNNR